MKNRKPFMVGGSQDKGGHNRIFRFSERPPGPNPHRLPDDDLGRFADLHEARVRELEASGGVAAIAAERQRQIDVEGWTAGHDDTYGEAVLARAAACYAVYGSRIESHEPPTWWPFNPIWWKPKNRRADLVRAGALIAAEIDRLDRKALAALAGEGE